MFTMLRDSTLQFIVSAVKNHDCYQDMLNLLESDIDVTESV